MTVSGRVLDSEKGELVLNVIFLLTRPLAIMKNYLFSALFSVGLLVALFCKPNAFADEPTDSTKKEQQKFNAKLNILQGHTELLPKKVDDVVKSLTETVRIRFDCPEGTKVSKVTINITTRQIKWDKQLTINGKKVKIPPNAVGYYIWHPTSIIKHGEKIIHANNFIMLYPNVADRQEKNPSFGPFADEALLYHEFLHGQLLIDAMFERDWKHQVCNCNLDLSPRDDDHEQIPALVYSYLQNLATLDEKVYTVNIPPQSAKHSDGNFEIMIVDASILDIKENWVAIPYYLERCNVDPASFDVRIKQGKIVAIGKLIDKSKKGFVIVCFNPRK